MFDLCVIEIPSITFFGVSQEEMGNVHAGGLLCKLKDRCLGQGVATILYQYLVTKLFTNLQMTIVSSI